MVIINSAIIKGGTIVFAGNDEDAFIGSNIHDAIIRSYNPPSYEKCLLRNTKMGESSIGNDKGPKFHSCILENVEIPKESIFEECVNP